MDSSRIDQIYEQNVAAGKGRDRAKTSSQLVV